MPLTRRPWSEFALLTSFTRPDSLQEAVIRLRRNLTHFRVNYALISLTILFLSLLFHPISLIVFFIIALIWYYIYFSDRDRAVRMWVWEIGDGVVIVVLSMITMVAIGVSGSDVWVNVVVSIGLSLCVVCVHGVFRNVDDLYCDEEEGFGDGLLISVVGSPISRRY